MTVQVKRSKLSYEDVSFGLSTFTRYGSTGALETVTQIRASHVPILDAAGIYNASDVEGALAEAKAIVDALDIPEDVHRVYARISSPWEARHAGCEIFLWNVYKSQVPPGVVTSYGGASAPDGWLLCNGQAVSRKSFAELYEAIGTTYGVGDGATTFNVPDLRSRFPIGAGQGAGLTNRAIGATGGAESVDLSHTHDFAHIHSLSAHTHTLGAHTHGLSNHTHSMQAHTHTLVTGGDITAGAGTGVVVEGAQLTWGGGTGDVPTVTYNTGAPSSASTDVPSVASTGEPSGGSDTPSTDETGAASPDSTTDSKLSATQTVMNPFVALNFIIKT